MAVGSDASRFGCGSGLVRPTGMTAALAILRPSDSATHADGRLSPLGRPKHQRDRASRALARSHRKGAPMPPAAAEPPHAVLLSGPQRAE